MRGQLIRLIRLEKLARLSGPKRPVVFKLYDDECPGPVAGLFALGGAPLPRRCNEALAALVDRASAELASRFLFASYLPPEPLGAPLWQSGTLPTLSTLSGPCGAFSEAGDGA